MPGSTDPPPQRTQQHCVESAKTLLPREARQVSVISISGAEKVQSKTATSAAKRAARKSPGRNGYRYKPQFGIVVITENERDQERAYARLQRAGFRKLRVVTV